MKAFIAALFIMFALAAYTSMVSLSVQQSDGARHYAHTAAVAR